LVETCAKVPDPVIGPQVHAPLILALLISAAWVRCVLVSSACAVAAKRHVSSGDRTVDAAVRRRSPTAPVEGAAVSAELIRELAARTQAPQSGVNIAAPGSTARCC